MSLGWLVVPSPVQDAGALTVTATLWVAVVLLQLPAAALLTVRATEKPSAGSGPEQVTW